MYAKIVRCCQLGFYMLQFERGDVGLLKLVDASSRPGNSAAGGLLTNDSVLPGAYTLCHKPSACTEVSHACAPVQDMLKDVIEEVPDFIRMLLCPPRNQAMRRLKFCLFLWWILAQPRNCSGLEHTCLDVFAVSTGVSDSYM